MPPRHIWQKLFDTSCDDNQIENQRRVTTSLYLPSWVGLTAGRGPFVLVACTYVLQPGIDVLQAYMLVDEPRLIWRCTLIPTGISNSALCPHCLFRRHTVPHIFNCDAVPTLLTLRDLWINPVKVVELLVSLPSFVTLIPKDQHPPGRLRNRHLKGDISRLLRAVRRLGQQQQLSPALNLGMPMTDRHRRDERKGNWSNFTTI